MACVRKKTTTTRALNEGSERRAHNQDEMGKERRRHFVEELVDVFRTNLTPLRTEGALVVEDDVLGFDKVGDALTRKGSFLSADASDNLSWRALSAGEGFAADEAEDDVEVRVRDARDRLGSGLIVLFEEDATTRSFSLPFARPVDDQPT